MKLKELLEYFDCSSNVICISDNDLSILYTGKVFSPKHDVYNNYKVISFGFYDNQLCVRISEKIYD